MLSIFVPTYNHEKYITKALDSILMQKTKYKYEVWVGEDCSTDNTKIVLQEYAKKLPHNFYIIFRDHNMYNEKIRNSMDLRARCRGKYIITLEGDDYWIDEKKIDIQIDFLESHSEYIAISHDCVVIDAKDKALDRHYPTCKEQEYSFQLMASEIMPGQLTTVMYRNPYKNDVYNHSLLDKPVMPGDRALYFWLLCNGKIYCMNRKMSAYRFVNDHGSSWSATYKYNFEQWNYLYTQLMIYANCIDNKEAIKYANFFFFKNLLKGIKQRKIGFWFFFKSIKNTQKLKETICMYIKYRINKNILRKKIWI